MREREQSPPKSVKSESEVRHVKFAECPSPDRLNERNYEVVEKELGELGYAAHCENASIQPHGGYGVVQVAEVEVSDDDD